MSYYREIFKLWKNERLVSCKTAQPVKIFANTLKNVKLFWSIFYKFVRYVYKKFSSKSIITPRRLTSLSHEIVLPSKLKVAY